MMLIIWVSSNETGRGGAGATAVWSGGGDIRRSCCCDATGAGASGRDVTGSGSDVTGEGAVAAGASGRKTAGSGCDVTGCGRDVTGGCRDMRTAASCGSSSDTCQTVVGKGI